MSEKTKNKGITVRLKVSLLNAFNEFLVLKHNQQPSLTKSTIRQQVVIDIARSITGRKSITVTPAGTIKCYKKPICLRIPSEIYEGIKEKSDQLELPVSRLIKVHMATYILNTADTDETLNSILQKILASDGYEEKTRKELVQKLTV